MAKKSIEDIYKKLTQEEHVLARPDTYVGSTLVQDKTMWSVNNTEFESSKITYMYLIV
jgi:DNA topoisomerase-2